MYGWTQAGIIGVLVFMKFTSAYSSLHAQHVQQIPYHRGPMFRKRLVVSVTLDILVRTVVSVVLARLASPGNSKKSVVVHLVRTAPPGRTRA